jgi:putative peptidoglycan lipid II flippase
LSTTRPVLVVTAGSVLQIVLQLAFQTFIARQFGLSDDAAAYEAAIPLPVVLAAILGLPLASVIIPVVSQTQKSDGDDSAWAAASRVGAITLAATVAFAALLFFAAAPLIRFLYGSFPKAPGLLRILAWLVPLNVMTALLQALHNWQGRFAISAIAGVIGPGVTLGMILYRGAALTIEDVAMAAVAGAVANVAIQAPSLLPRFRWTPDVGATRRALILFVPLLLGGIYLRVDPLVDRAIAKRFFNENAVVACLGYSSRTINAVLAVAVGGLSVVTFPRMARAAALGVRELGHEFSGALRGLITILVPLIVAWAVFAPEILRDLYERGKFVPEDTARVALFVRCALGVVIGGSLGEIASRAFYASHDMRTPTLLGVGCFTIAIVLKLLLSWSFGPAGVLAAASIAWCLCAAAQLLILKRRFGAELLDGAGSRLIVTLVGAAAACLAGGAVTRLDVKLPGVWGGLAGLLVYIAAMALLIRRRDETSEELLPPTPPIAEESPPPVDIRSA